MPVEPAQLFSECAASSAYMQTAQMAPRFPNDATKFLSGIADYETAGGGGATVQGTAGVLQKGNGPNAAIDSALQDLGINGIHFFLGDLGHGALDVLSVKRLNFADVVISGESGADILMQSGTGGSFSIATDGGAGDDVVLSCGQAGSGPTIHIKPDRFQFQIGLLESLTADIAGELTLAAGTVRYNFIKALGAGKKAVVIISPKAAPLGVLHVLSDATGFDVTSSNVADTVTVGYIVIVVPV